MAGKGAYYAAATIANQVKPVDFGEIALGFAKVSESKRLEAKQDEKLKEDFLMKQRELYGEEVIGAFDNTGIDNLDGVALKIKDQIKKQAEVLNALYRDGKISKSQMDSRMFKLSKSSEEFRGVVDNVVKFVKDTEALGGESSEYNRYVLDRLKTFESNMVPVFDGNGDMAFISDDGEKTYTTPLKDMAGMLTAKKGVSDSELFKGVMQGIKPSTIVRGSNVVSTYIPGGDISSNTKNYINEWVGNLTNDELIDLASKNNIKHGDGLTIDNPESLKKQLAEVYQNKTKAYLLDQEVNNEKDGIVLSLQQGRFAISKEQEKRAKKLFDKQERKAVKITDVNESGQAFEQYNIPIDKAFDIAPFIEGVVGKDRKPLGHMGKVQLTQLNKVNVGTPNNPVYEYTASVYFMQQSGETIISDEGFTTPQTPKYETVNLPEQTYNKFRNIFEDVEEEPKTDLNSLFN